MRAKSGIVSTKHGMLQQCRAGGVISWHCWIGHRSAPAEAIGAVRNKDALFGTSMQHEITAMQPAFVLACFTAVGQHQKRMLPWTWVDTFLQTSFIAGCLVTPWATG